MRHLIGLLTALALLAAACDGDTVTLGGEGDAGADAVELGSDDGTGAAPAGETDAPAATDAPATGDSSDEQAPADGVETIRVGEAGEVDVRVMEGRRLELVEVREADGWTHRVDDLERDGIEIDFRHSDGRTVELEVELDDGRLDVEIG